jgi:thiol-disulfide isomerase/thioredoxin
MCPCFGRNRVVLCLLVAAPFLGASRAKDDRPPLVRADTRQLEGRAAPPLALETPAGDDVSLADAKGSVVVLHFWASWCGPCHESMPLIQAIADDKTYLARGMKVFAVNRREDDSRIAAFTQRLKLSLPVLMDESETASTKYLVAAMPTTVVVGRDGVVAKVLVGVGEEFDAKLRQAIDAALAASTRPATGAATDRTEGKE